MGKGGQRTASLEAQARGNLLSTEAAEELVAKSKSSKHPHGERRAEILQNHPEIKQFFGTYIGTFYWSLACVIAQVTLSIVATKYLSAWFWVPLAYFVGAVIDHAIWVLIHDATHNLIFQSVHMNRFVLLWCNIPHIFPSAMSFRYYHILHHIELNRANKDPDVPFEWEARLIGNSPLRKSVWLAFFFIVQALRTVFYTHRIPKGIEIAWMLLNWVTNISFCVILVLLTGWLPLTYLIFSSICSIGLHPLGARWIQEHYPTQPFQATYSYYGIANRFAFAIGYHVEHHDFPSVPWNKLAAVKAAAPEYYDTLFAYTSYFELLKDFILQRKWSLIHRFETERDRSQITTDTDAFTRKQKQT